MIESNTLRVGWLTKVSANRIVLMLLAGGLLSLPATGAEGERYRTLWHGSRIDVIERNGLAVAEGDLVLGPINQIREGEPGSNIGRSGIRLMSLVDPNAVLWPRSSSGAVEIPYVFEAG